MRWRGLRSFPTHICRSACPCSTHCRRFSLTAQKLVSRLDLEGGWYAILRAPAVQSDEDLAMRILERSGVLVQPGHFYEFPEAGYLVVSLLTPRADFEAGIRGLLV